MRITEKHQVVQAGHLQPHTYRRNKNEGSTGEAKEPLTNSDGSLLSKNFERSELIFEGPNPAIQIYPGRFSNKPFLCVIPSGRTLRNGFDYSCHLHSRIKVKRNASPML